MDELEIRVKVLEGDLKPDRDRIIVNALKAYIDHIRGPDGIDVPSNGQMVVDDAVVWWCLRSFQ